MKTAVLKPSSSFLQKGSTLLADFDHLERGLLIAVFVPGLIQILLDFLLSPPTLRRHLLAATLRLATADVSQ
jgi:hypothetical protein